MLNIKILSLVTLESFLDVSKIADGWSEKQKFDGHQTAPCSSLFTCTHRGVMVEEEWQRQAFGPRRICHEMREANKTNPHTHIIIIDKRKWVATPSFPFTFTF